MTNKTEAYRAEITEYLKNGGQTYVEGLVYDGKEYTGTDAVGKLCRVLASHSAPSAMLEIYRGEKLSLRIPIAQRAGMMLSESDKQILKLKPYQPFPKDIFI